MHITTVYLFLGPPRLDKDGYKTSGKTRWKPTYHAKGGTNPTEPSYCIYHGAGAERSTQAG